MHVESHYGRLCKIGMGKDENVALDASEKRKSD
jgi:hypothetical protein